MVFSRQTSGPHDHPGLAEAAARLSTPVRERLLHTLLDRHLEPGEGVELVAIGAHASTRGLVALTDHRVVFTEEQLGAEPPAVALVESFDLADITEVAWHRRGNGGTLTVRGGHRCAQLRRVAIADGMAEVQALRERLRPVARPLA